jgi:hypothetical protein
MTSTFHPRSHCHGVLTLMRQGLPFVKADTPKINMM